MIQVPEKEVNRLKALKSYTILDTLPEEEFDRLTKLVSIVSGMPISLITLLDEERQWFKSNIGLDATQTPRRDAFCHYTIQKDSLMEIKDTWNDALFRDNPLVTGPPNIRFYAGYPLIDPDGHALGALCVIDRKPNELNDHQQEILALLAEEVVSQIVARKEKMILKNYEKLFLESIDMITVAGTDGYFRKVNPAFRTTLGWSEEELLKNQITSFIHPEDVDKTIQALERLAYGENVMNITIRFRTSTGAIKHLQWIATPDITNGNIYAIGRDITEFTQIQTELADLSKFQRKILDGTTFAIISTNPEGTITTFNRGAEALLGYEAHEVVQKLNLLDCFEKKGLIRKARKFAKTFDTPLMSVIFNFKTKLVGNGTDANEWTFVKKDGSVIMVELTVSTLEKDDNELSGYLITGRDITNRKAALNQLEISERRHRAFFENSQSIMCTHDLNGDISTFNPAGVQMLGYEYGELQVKSLYDIVVPEHQDDISLYLQEIKKRGKLKGLMRVVGRDGMVKTWMYNNVLSEFADGRKYVIGNAVDLTQRIIIENELVMAKENAERNARAKDIFLANMSHEIRTPMNAIMGFANLLKDTPLTREQWEFTENIGYASANLMGIINDILDLSKIESGHLVIEEIAFNLKELIKNVKVVLNQKAIEKNLRLTILIEDDVPDRVMGDPTRLNQVLLNLVNNAIKFTNEGSVKMIVEVKESSPTVNTLKFSIVDTGIGIQEEKLKTIFERFTQADADTTRKYGGTGLGLSISKLLIELQQGSIDVKSQINEGSTFYFTIPFKKVEKTVETKNESTPSYLVSQNRLKILLVEDNVLNQRLASKLLQNFGFECELAENGKIAVEKVRNNQYSLILMDLQMPEMDGYQATTAIREELGSKVPIVAMTAHSLVGEKEKCFAVGMNEYLPKPFSPAALFNIITQKAQVSENSEPANDEQESVVDLTYLKTISNGDSTLEKDLITLFLSQAPVELVNMDKAIREKDDENLREIAHKLKSSYALIGVQEKGLLQQLELHGIGNTTVDNALGAYTKLTTLTERAIMELKAILTIK